MNENDEKVLLLFSLFEGVRRTRRRWMRREA
jgi:hypothetical protein